MAANPAAPVAVGTRGTVGSLIRKEIEYFRTVEFSDQRRSQKRPQAARSLEMGSNSIHCKAQASRPSFWFFGLSWRRKKQRVGGGFRSSMCSPSDASDIERPDDIRGFNYMILRDEFKTFQSY
ncbi:uncharacterized protein LOC116204267 [Punica granatum]|uniref:Uncharacterized protein n=2 Tax=Punica granatum TaxID=22663 RepID=A0A2I0KV35_PUNGR|nr:uncharacterized protein LOC116204267 [Punica granatum]PKI72319.1 hypothetical protein CRG98_007299 [Punica granatum]